MIVKFIEAFENNKQNLKNKFIENPPESYKDIVTSLVEILPGLDPESITENYDDWFL